MNPNRAFRQGPMSVLQAWDGKNAAVTFSFGDLRSSPVKAEEAGESSAAPFQIVEFHTDAGAGNPPNLGH